MAPFADLGVAGAITSKSRRTGGTDHTSFNAAGLPGIGTQLDPMEYQSHTWHTNLDTYERIVEDDVKAQAAVIAGVVYELAMRDEKLPAVHEGGDAEGGTAGHTGDAGAGAPDADGGVTVDCPRQLAR